MTVMHPNGLGESLGDSLIIGGPLYASVSVWWVSSSEGDDANGGKEARQPLATLAAAITAATDGDMIVLKDGHTETLTAAVTINKRLTIIGSGQSAGKPTVKLTPNAASAQLLIVTAAGVELRNIWFEENLQANAEVRIDVGATRFRMVGCYVECNGFDESEVLDLSTSAAIHEIRNTTFISTATAATLVPNVAVKVSTAAARVIMHGVTFDGGAYGFTDGIAYTESAAVTEVKAESISLLRGADMVMHLSSLGWVQTSVSTGNSRVMWTAGGG